MITHTNLSIIPGAELIERDGERGMFVPIDALSLGDYNGKPSYYLRCALSPRRKRKNRPNSTIIAQGRLIYPEWTKDMRLESPLRLSKDPVIQWVSNPKVVLGGVEGVMEDAIFKDVLGR